MFEYDHQRISSSVKSTVRTPYVLGLFLIFGLTRTQPAQGSDTDSRASAAVAKMSIDEQIRLLHGPMAVPIFNTQPPVGAVPGAGFIPGVKRLAIPNLTETDASLGVGYVGGMRHDGATALPSGMALGATWSPETSYRSGVTIGSEAKAKGFNVMLAGGANLIRDPRNGRTFEYLSEDPLLTGMLAGASIRGIQSNHIVSTIKHFALNDQETGRKGADVTISDAAARESDLLAFELGIEVGQPGAVMCSYNLVNGSHACASDYLLNKVLKTDWRYRGWVMSDWGAVTSATDALNGLDQESGEQLDRNVYFGSSLEDLAKKDPNTARRVADMATRIVRSLYATGADTDRPATTPIDYERDARVAEETEKQGMVLLRNTGILPLQGAITKIAVIGGYADTGVLSGGGSSQTQGEGGPAATVPHGGTSPFASLLSEAYQRSNPLLAIKARAGDAEVTFRDGRYTSEAISLAKSSDVVIIFATQWMSEGLDVPDLSLPAGQDALIESVVAVNPHTIVVLETGGPVLTPWLSKTAAVLEAWYPGARGAEAIASVLFGETNPSGRLPVTFPASTDQLPRPKLDGSDRIEPNFLGETDGKSLHIDYNVEGSDVGYRWFARTGARPQFPFGFGLSYTRFEESGLRLHTQGAVVSAKVVVTNAGARAGSEVVQIYLTGRAGLRARRLVGFQKIQLRPGETSDINIRIDPRLLAGWSGNDWIVRAGDYTFSIGKDSEHLEAAAVVHLSTHHIAP